MNARSLGLLAAISFAVLALLLFCQAIVLHLRIHYPITRTDYYLSEVAGRGAPWAYFWDTIVADVAIVFHSPFEILFWLAISALIWGVVVNRPGP